MKLFTVLGYSSNEILKDYNEKYFHFLLGVFEKINVGETLGGVFFSFNKEHQKVFLLHPDISSLLQNIHLHNSFHSFKKFIKELYYFCNKKYQELTLSQGNLIPGTQIYLTDRDNNPTNSIVNHPDHDKEMIGWGERDEQEWIEIFGKTFLLLNTIEKGFYDELNYIIKKIVPMKTSMDVHNSCSYKECIGTLYIGYTINSHQPELNILEAIIHESSHNKLNLIMQSDQLHVNNFDLKYYSPYRPDARHIEGVFFGVHALVPTVYVMLKVIESGYVEDILWHEKVLLYHIKNKLGYRVLQKYGSFTPIGKQILNDIGEVIKLCDKRIHTSLRLHKSNILNIQKRAKQHFLKVQENHPYLKY